MRTPKSEVVPPDGNPSWVNRCRPLLFLLREKPRTHDELTAWRKTMKIGPNMLTQMLAWCENRKVACYRGRRWWVGWFRTPEAEEDEHEHEDDDDAP